MHIAPSATMILPYVDRVCLTDVKDDLACDEIVEKSVHVHIIPVFRRLFADMALNHDDEWPLEKRGIRT